jgi:TRAP-type uncharacterized transport system fused permease subunit
MRECLKISFNIEWANSNLLSRDKCKVNFFFLLKLNNCFVEKRNKPSQYYSILSKRIIIAMLISEKVDGCIGWLIVCLIVQKLSINRGNTNLQTDRVGQFCIPTSHQRQLLTVIYILSCCTVSCVRGTLHIQWMYLLPMLMLYVYLISSVRSADYSADSCTPQWRKKD